MHDGKKWWWCPNHMDGKGMYVRHPPEDHAEWQSKKGIKGPNGYFSPDRRRPSANVTSGGDANKDGTGKNDVDTGNLELGSELKRVLATFGLSDADAESAWNTALGASKK